MYSTVVKYFTPHCLIIRPALSDSSVSEDAEIEPRTAATLALAVRLDALTTRLDLIHQFTRLDLIHTPIHSHAARYLMTTYGKPFIHLHGYFNHKN